MVDIETRGRYLRSMETAPGEAWWRGAIIYHIHPRSFLDTSGNGIGDPADGRVLSSEPHESEGEELHRKDTATNRLQLVLPDNRLGTPMTGHGFTALCKGGSVVLPPDEAYFGTLS